MNACFAFRPRAPLQCITRSFKRFRYTLPEGSAIRRKKRCEPLFPQTSHNRGEQVAYIGAFRDGWRAQIQKDGIRISKTFKLKREAQAWAIAQESKKSLNRDQTLEKAVERYLDTVSKDKTNAVDWERRRFTSMMAYFGHSTAIADIDSDKVGQWRDMRLQTVLGSTVQREANLLRNLFTIACDEWRWIERNPFKGVRLPKTSAPRHQIWPWQLIKRVLRAPRTGKTREMQTAFHIALRTGMRLSEVLNAPANYDPKRQVVTIKTKTEIRAQIPIGRIADKLMHTTFTVSANEGSTLFSRLCRELLIDGLTFHDARGTALTHLSKKVDVLTLAKISRHKDLSLLSNVYYRATPESIAKRI